MRSHVIPTGPQQWASLEPGEPRGLLSGATLAAHCSWPQPDTGSRVCEGGLTKFGPPHHGMGERTPASQRRPPSPPQVLQKAPASVPRGDVQDRPAYWCCAVHDTCLRPASRCMLPAYLLPPGEGHCSSHLARPDRAAGGRVVVLGGSERTWQRLSSPRKWTMACTLENLPQQTHSSAPLNWGRLRPAGRD